MRAAIIVFVLLSLGLHATETNVVAGRMFKRPLGDVRVALQTLANPKSHPGSFTFATNELPGRSYSITFADCTPPAPKSIIPQKLRRLTGAARWEPKRETYWTGKFLATAVTTNTTRLEVVQKPAAQGQVRTQQAIAESYIDRLEDLLPNPNR